MIVDICASPKPLAIAGAEIGLYANPSNQMPMVISLFIPEPGLSGKVGFSSSNFPDPRVLRFPASAVILIGFLRAGAQLTSVSPSPGKAHLCLSAGWTCSMNPNCNA